MEMTKAQAVFDILCQGGELKLGSGSNTEIYRLERRELRLKRVHQVNGVPKEIWVQSSSTFNEILNRIHQTSTRDLVAQINANADLIDVSQIPGFDNISAVPVPAGTRSLARDIDPGDRTGLDIL